MTSRLAAIEWSEPARLAQARILVVGAGALGNEVLKNLALVGAGNVVVVDMDRIELSNLSRSVLFRETDQEQCQSRGGRRDSARAVSPGERGSHRRQRDGGRRTRLVPLGAGDHRGARQPRSPRVREQRLRHRGAPVDQWRHRSTAGMVRVRHPGHRVLSMHDGEGGLGAAQPAALLLAAGTAGGPVARGTPTTPTTASVVGALQAQEAIKLLHGLDPLLGRGVVFDGARNDWYTVSYPIAKDCGSRRRGPRVSRRARTRLR